MVPECDRLCALQMGISRHDGCFVAFRLVGYGGNQLFQQRRDRIDLLHQVHPQIQRHLVVPAARGVQFFSHISHTCRQHFLHKHMDILAGRVEGKRAAFQILEDPLQPRNQGVGFLCPDDSRSGKHGGVRHASPDVLPEHPAVKSDG